MKTNTLSRFAPVRVFAALVAGCLLAAASLPVFAAAARDSDDLAREAWMSGYMKYEAAAKAEEDGNQPLALDLFREALDVFKRVQARHPDWNPSLLDYRANYCAQRIRSLEVTVAAKNTSLTREGLISLTKSQEARLRQFNQENSDIKKKMELIGKSLEQARAEAAVKVAVVAEMDRVLKENADLKEAQAASASREAGLRAENEKLRSDTGLKKKAEQLQATLDVALDRKTELERSEAENKAALSRLNMQLKDASLRRNQLEQEAAPLKKKLENVAKIAEAKDEALAKVRRQVGESQKDAARAAQQVAGLEKQIQELEHAVGRQKNELADAKELCASSLRDLRAANSGLDDARGEVRTLKSVQAKLEAELRTVKAEKDAVTATAGKELAIVRSELGSRDGELRKVKSAQAKLAEDLRLAQAEVKTAREQADELVAAKGTAEAKLAIIIKERESLQEKCGELSGDRDTLARTMETGKAEAARLNADLEKTAADCAMATRRLEEASSRAIAAETRSVKLERQLIEAESAVKTGGRKVNEAEKRAVLAERRAWKAEAVTAEAMAAVKDLRARIGGKGAEAGKAIEAELRRQLAAVNNDLEKLRAKSVKTEASLASAEKQAAASAAELEALRTKPVAASAAVETLRKQVAARDAELEKARLQLVKHDGEMKAAHQRQAALESEKSDFAAFRVRAEKTMDELFKSNADYKENIQKVKTNMDALIVDQNQYRTQSELVVRELRQQKAEAMDMLDKANRKLAQAGSSMDSPVVRKLLEQKDAELKAAADLQVKYEAALAALKGQKAKAEGELAVNVRKLGERDAELQQTRDQADKLKKQLAAGSLKVNDVAEKLADAQQENERFGLAIEKVQRRNGELNATVDAFKAAMAAAEQKNSDSAEKLAETQKMRVTADAEAKALKGQYEQTLQLARSQEEKLSSLEKTASSQMQMLKDGEAKAKSLEASLTVAADKITALEAMLPAKADAEATANTLAMRVKKAEQDNAALAEKLKGTAADLRQARVDLTRERVAKTGNDAMLDQLRRINRELDQERDKNKALEQTVENLKTKPADGAAAASLIIMPPPATSATPIAEQQRRAADRVVIVNGFLQKGADAEKLGKPEAAVWNYKKVLEYQSDNKLACKRLGVLASRRSNQEEAESYLRRAFYADPDDVDVLLPLGLALVRQGKADLAVSMLARAVSLRPEDANIHRTYGIACSQLGWRDAAEVQFLRALKINPKDSDAAFNLAVLLASAKPPRLQEAQPWYKRACELGVPPDPGLDKLFSGGE